MHARVHPSAWTVLFALIGPALGPATSAAQWTRVMAVPPADVYSIHVRGDSLFAGVDTAVYVSVNGGGSWQRSARVGPTVGSVDALFYRNGRLWAGTFGQGVFVTDNLGSSWTARSQGLAGGAFNSHLYINDFGARGDSLHAATDGAGVFRIDLRAPGAVWARFGNAFETNTAGDVLDLVSVGSRLVAGAGGNGLVFRNDLPATDWIVELPNGGLLPGMIPSGLAWTGSQVVVCGSGHCFRSPTGAAPWTPVPPNVGATLECRLVARGSQVHAVFNKLGGGLQAVTFDHGAHWNILENLPAYVYELAVHDTTLYAARSDGLWRQSVATVGVPPDGGPAGARATLHLVGGHPVRAEARFRLTLPKAGHVLLTVLDATGREAARLFDGSMEAGERIVTWDARSIAPGVYFARLASGRQSEGLRFVRLP